MMKTLAAAPFVLVVEGWNVKTGLGSRFGSYLLQAGSEESSIISAPIWRGAAACGSKWGIRFGFRRYSGRDQIVTLKKHSIYGACYGSSCHGNRLISALAGRSGPPRIPIHIYLFLVLFDPAICSTDRLASCAISSAIPKKPAYVLNVAGRSEAGAMVSPTTEPRIWYRR